MGNPATNQGDTHAMQPERRGRGRPKLLDEPTPVLVRVEVWERSMLEALASLNGWTLTDEMRLAVRKHLRSALDDDAPAGGCDRRDQGVPSRAQEAGASA